MNSKDFYILKTLYKKYGFEKVKGILDFIFNFVENSWWNKKNHQYDNLKTNFV